MEDRAYEIAINRNYDWNQRTLARMLYIFFFFDKKKRSGVSVNEQLTEELHEPVTKKFKRKKIYVRFKDNI